MRLLFKCCALSTIVCMASCAICFIFFFKHEIHGVAPTPYFMKHGNKTNGTFRVYFNNNTQNATNMDRVSCDCDAFQCWQQQRMHRWAISFPVPVARGNDKYGLGLTHSERNCWLQNTTLLPLSDLDAFDKNDCRDSHIVLVSASKDRGGHQLFRETRRRYANAHNYSFFIVTVRNYYSCIHSTITMQKVSVFCMRLSGIQKLTGSCGQMMMSL